MVKAEFISQILKYQKIWEEKGIEGVDMYSLKLIKEGPFTDLARGIRTAIRGRKVKTDDTLIKELCEYISMHIALGEDPDLGKFVQLCNAA